MDSPSILPLNLLPFFEALPDCYLLLSPELVIQAVTDGYLKTTFTQREQLVGKPLFEAFTGQPGRPEAATLQHLKQSLQRVLNSKLPESMPVQHFKLPDPEKPKHKLDRYWKPFNTPVLDENGDVLYIIHKVDDVTKLIMQNQKLEDMVKREEIMEVIANDNLHLWYQEQQKVKQAYEKLVEEHRRLQDAQTLGHIGSFERMYENEIIYCSDEFYRIHGLEPQSEEMTLEKMISFLHPDEQEILRKQIWQSRTFIEPLDLMHRIVWRDGTIRHVHRRAVVTPDENGKPKKVYGTVQDITTQVEAQEKLRTSEAFLREAEAFGHTGSYEGDLTTGKFRFSDNMYRLLGLEPQSIVPDLELINSMSHPEDAVQIHKIIDQAIREKKSYQYLRRIYLSNGEMRYIFGNGKVICDADGKAVKILGTVQDITKRDK